MKKPLQLTLSIYQGQTFNDVLALSDDTTGDPVDLTGYSAKMQARFDIADTSPVLTWSSDTGEIVLGGTEGTITFAVGPAATAALPTQNDVLVLAYDMVLSQSAGAYTERLVQGALVVYPGVTRG